jgi:hypothetical protein
MNDATTRRDLIQCTLTAGVLAGLPLAISAGDSTATLWDEFPRQDAKLVGEVVGAAHANEARVKELVQAHPALVNAWWDWGFGDWESPLGAASHVGRRSIAEFLLEKGARIDIFAAAMLGMTSVVKAFVTAQPGVQRTLGPHGITLLKHARAGGKQAADTLAYLESLGDADVGLKATTLAAEKTQVYLGKYSSSAVNIECRLNSNGLLIVVIKTSKVTASPRVLHHVGEHEFFSAGVPSVRFRFAVENGKASELTIKGTDLHIIAKRNAG